MAHLSQANKKIFSIRLVSLLKKGLSHSFRFGKRGLSFTLVELLIVIGILAILVAAIVVVLNPAQLLAQARDSKRQQDLTSLNQALSLIEQQSGEHATWNDLFSTTTVFTSLVDASSSECMSLDLPVLPDGWTYHCVADQENLRKINGNGWVPLDFNLLSNGITQLSALPVDPVNTASSGFYYTFVAGGSFSLSGIMESDKYRSKQISDGGLDDLSYERGSDMSLAPFSRGMILHLPFISNTQDHEVFSSGDVSALGSIISGDSSGGDIAITTDCFRETTCLFLSKKGLLSGSVTTTPANPTGKDYLKNISTSSFSIGAWVKTEKVNNAFFVGNTSRTDNAGFSLVFDKDSFVFSITEHDCAGIFCRYVTTKTSAQSSLFDQWVYLVGVRDVQRQLVSLYINGKLVAQKNHVTNPSNSAEDLMIGDRDANEGTLSVGDIVFYKKALSASEVATLYESFTAH